MLNLASNSLRMSTMNSVWIVGVERQWAIHRATCRGSREAHLLSLGTGQGEMKLDSGMKEIKLKDE